MYFFKNKPKTIQSNELGVVCIEQDFLSKIITLDSKLLQAAHGVHNIKIHYIYYDTKEHMICAIVSSPDIPEYVAFHNIMEDIVYKEINGRKYPLLCLTYGMWLPQPLEDSEGYDNIGREKNNDAE